MGIAPRVTVADQVERAEQEGWQYTGDMRTEGEVLELIHSLVRATKPGVCVETGTYTGHGTQAISDALVSNDKGHLWTVENDLEKRYPPTERTTFIGGDSVAWSESDDCPANIDFAFVDCGPPEIRAQVFENLLPKMRDTGLILVHDSTFYEPAFTQHLSMIHGSPPAINLRTLNGVVIWQA